MIFKIIIFLSVGLSFLHAGIANTKHNLSSSGTGTIKSSTEKEICAFCHIPHAAQAGKPLWNREMPTSTYTMYSSTYLERTTYPTPSDLGSSVDTPGNLSRQCLSCHDGTIAIGGIYALRGTVLGSALSVNNTNPDGTMPNSSTAFIGTDLSAHHPVGFEYGATMTFSDVDVTTRGNELNATPTSPVKVYRYSGKDYVECSSCHDPHAENGKFLRVNGGSHAENIKNTCTSCHNKDGWSGSAHESNTTAYTDTTVLADYGGTTTVAKMGCVNCHTPHNGEGQPYLLRKIEQNTCFQGAASSPATAKCHNINGAKDIETQLNKLYGHGFPLLNIDDTHTNLDYAYGNGKTRNPIGSKGISWNDSIHVECMDCHNQHQAKPITRTVSTNWYPTTQNSNSNKINGASATDGPLKGASGVKPTAWPTTRWTKPTSYTSLETATYEYEVCFKCHSSYALDNDTTPMSTYNTTSDATIPFTDTAWEFNINNRSGHPVTVSGNSRTTGSALIDAQMKLPWTQAEGTQTMMCSDCHGANNETTDSKGPHGSTIKFMLKGAGTYWPTNSVGNHYKIGESESDANRTSSGLFCQNCHNLDVSRSDKGNIPHKYRNEMNGLYCVRCHVAIPHGSPLSRLQAYSTFPEPYDYNNNMVKQLGFNKSNNYQRENTNFGSWTVSAPESNSPDKACNTKHDVTSGFESSPY